MPGCLDENGVVELLHGALSPAAKESVAAHLGSCNACRKLVAESTLALSGPGQGGFDTAPLHAGATLGRYVIITPVGGGAMGLVYSAYDRELGRKVALKLLRPAALESAPVAGDVLRARLRREAQALAQLTHPNVVAVHDVDSFEGRIFLAMEFVEGETLSAWLRQQKRSWREVVEIFRQAGEGLAAAHAAGLVHRDFKPDNVLVGADGRVRVTDFGLARASEVLASPAAAPEGSAPALDSSLTETGALIGTPAYMSPEQLSPGGKTDGLSDQFSFCVAFYEALVGERPFRAEDVAGLREAVRQGRLQEPAGGARVPGWLLRIVRRGLAAEPAARFPSMRALLGRLSRGPLLTPLRAAAALAAAALLGLVAWSARDVCAGVDRGWGQLWSEEQRAAVRTAFAAAGDPGGEVFTRVDRALATLRSSWSAMRVDACRAARARHEQSETLLELRVLCLEDRRREAEALVHLFEAGSAATVEHAIKAVDALTPLSRCAATRALIERAPPPADPAARAQVEEASELLARAKAFADAENPDPAMPLAERAFQLARSSGHKPTEARAIVQRANLARAKSAKNSYGQVEEWLHLAAATAQEGRDDGVAADAFIQLSFVRGYERGSQAEAELWSRYAAAAINRLGGDEQREALRLEKLAGVYLNDEQNADIAREHLLRARALYVHAGAPETRIATLDDPLASVAVITGRLEEGIKLYRSVIEAKARLYGSSRPTLSDDNLGEALRLAHRPVEAIAAHRRVWEEMHRQSWYSAQKLAQALRAAGQGADEAMLLDRAAIEILESRSGPDNPHLMGPLVGLGEDLMAQGRVREALAPLERAVRLPSGVSDENPGLAQLALARALWDSGADRERARSLAAGAREQFRALAARRGSYYQDWFDEADRWLADPARAAPLRADGARPQNR